MNKSRDFSSGIEQPSGEDDVVVFNMQSSIFQGQYKILLANEGDGVNTLTSDFSEQIIVEKL